ncbi:hypothetical protein ABFS83_13G052100 [Erythranthe nasuta]
MIATLATDSHIIGTSMFRMTRWANDFKFEKDSPIVATWIKLPRLPFYYFTLPYLERTCNYIGKHLRADEKSINLQNLIHARICVDVDVSVPNLDWRITRK